MRNWNAFRPFWSVLKAVWSVCTAVAEDGFPYLVESSPELPSVVQRILEGIGPTGLKVILCGSSQRMMQGLVLDESEPLYGRERELLKLKPLRIEWMKVAFPKLSDIGWLEHYGVWGGVPRYWELSVGERNLWETVRGFSQASGDSLPFQACGPLVGERRKRFADGNRHCRRVG